jgi:hypothetical protein
MLTLSVVMLAATQAAEPKPYPPGQFCSPKGDVVHGTQTSAHPCTCRRHDTPDGNDPEAKKMCQAGEATNPSHDPICQQWCSEEHCLCPVVCDTAQRGGQHGQVERTGGEVSGTAVR